MLSTSHGVHELRINKIASYRIKKIEVQRGDAIDQIKITYDDDTIWYNGHDGGKTDPRTLVMTQGEYLVRVTHERLFNNNCAGAAVEFETNKGRIFSYQPLRVATKWKQELTTITAEEGNEIVGLIIRRGVLLGSEQQPVPLEELRKHSPHWYVIATYNQKEESGVADASNVIYKDYYSKSEALKSWKAKLTAIKTKKGRAGILIDCMKSNILQKGGSEEGITICTDNATTSGYCAPCIEEEVSSVEVIMTLYKYLGNWGDLWRFILITCLLFLHFHLQVESDLLAGHVLSSLVSNETSTTKENIFVNMMCKYVLSCDGSKASMCSALIITYILVRMVAMFVYVWNVFIHHHLCEGKAALLRGEIFGHVLSLDQRFYDIKSASQIKGSMNSRALSNLMCWNVPYLLAFILKFLIISYHLILMNFSMGAFCVITLLTLKFFMISFTRYERRFHKAEHKLRIVDNQIVSDVLNMISSVKMFSKEKHHVEEYDAVQQRYIKNLDGVVSLRCIREFINNTATTLVFGGAVYCGVVHYQESNITAGELTGFFLVLRDLQGLVDRIDWLVDFIIRDFRDIERFNTLLRQKPSILDGKVKPKEIKGEISFTDVHFEYPSRPGDKVLKGFNMTVQPHKMTAIVGDSGAGKSTIAKLIMRMYDVTAGSITIDGENIKDFEIKELHKHMAFVDQNPKLFDLSLAENIGYGVVGDDYMNDDIDVVAKLCNCGFISKFRAGFDTHAGSGGSQISGGQKQRIAIARAAIRDPRILILDEATSSLDAENEKDVQEALENVMAGRTIIVIAHRLSTIKNADVIMCMKDGEVVERGTHEELMEQNGVYHNLISKQIVKEKDV